MMKESSSSETRSQLLQELEQELLAELLTRPGWLAQLEDHCLAQQDMTTFHQVLSTVVPYVRSNIPPDVKQKLRERITRQKQHH